MKIVLATHDSIFGRYLAATLVEAGVVDRVIVETAKAKPSFYWRKLKKVGPVNFAFQYWLNRWYEREGAKVLPNLAMPEHERVRSLNGLVFDHDELVIGFGTSYVNPQTLRLAPNGILNLHTGILPQYRGVKSEYWALLNGDIRAIGWTLHRMTERLDEGDIVQQRCVEWKGESPGQIRGVIVRDAMTMLSLFLKENFKFDVKVDAWPQADSEAHYYTTPLWRDWLVYKRKRYRSCKVIDQSST